MANLTPEQQANVPCKECHSAWTDCQCGNYRPVHQVPVQHSPTADTGSGEWEAESLGEELAAHGGLMTETELEIVRTIVRRICGCGG
jgi:hypothetical protein